MRSSFAVLVLFVSAAIADEPIPLEKDRRSEAIAKWQKAYKSRITAAEAKAEQAKILMSNPRTANEGRKRLREATESIASLKKDPFQVGTLRIQGNSKEGDFGPLAAASAIVVDSDVDGTLIDIAYIVRGGVVSGGRIYSNMVTETARILLRTKTKAKSGTKVKIDGLWLVTDVMEIDGKRIPVLYRIEPTAEDIPK